MQDCVEGADQQPGELRILAAEDNPTNQMVLQALLGSAGLIASLVDDGQAAVEAWERGAWDLILMDIQMPVLHGASAAAAIRRREGETGRARTPIIAVTANVMDHQVREYGDIGMDGVVAKPINVAVLFEAMSAVLDGDPDAAQERVA